MITPETQWRHSVWRSELTVPRTPLRPWLVLSSCQATRDTASLILSPFLTYFVQRDSGVQVLVALPSVDPEKIIRYVVPLRAASYYPNINAIPLMCKYVFTCANVFGCFFARSVLIFFLDQTGSLGPK